MEFLVLVVIVVAIALFFAAKVTLGTDSQHDDWPFYAKKPLPAPEQVLYFRLSKSLPEHIVLAQVGLSRLLGVKKGNNFQAWYNRINRLQISSSAKEIRVSLQLSSSMTPHTNAMIGRLRLRRKIGR